MNPNSDHALCRELLADARDFIKPYIEGTNICICGDGALSISDATMAYRFNPLFDVYESFRLFIIDICTRHRSFDKLQQFRIRHILNNAKLPRDYTIVLKIIFKMIRKGFLNKQKVIDAVCKTENTAALVELIKFEDYSVFNERLQL